jgi:hypothetical protein
LDSVVDDLQETVGNFKDEDLKNICLKKLPKDLFSFSFGQVMIIGQIIQLMSDAKEGKDPVLFSQLVGTSNNHINQSQQSEYESPQPSKRFKSVAESCPNRRVNITHENVLGEFAKFIAKHMNETPRIITAERRATSQYPFKLDIKCYKCHQFKSSVRVSKEGVKGYTRFRADLYINHIKGCGNNSFN